MHISFLLLAQLILLEMPLRKSHFCFSRSHSPKLNLFSILPSQPKSPVTEGLVLEASIVRRFGGMAEKNQEPAFTTAYKGFNMLQLLTDSIKKSDRWQGTGDMGNNLPNSRHDFQFPLPSPFPHNLINSPFINRYADAPMVMVSPSFKFPMVL